MAFMQDDETMRLYVEESREYLADLEADLLRMEECGAAIDEELVNRVFRAAHTIKGGAGFFGLTTIQALAHKVENILDMVRSRELVPNPEIINLLLIAFDRLRELINDVEHSNEQDVSDHVAGLVALAEGNLPPSQKASVDRLIDVPDAHGPTGLTVSEFDLRHIAKAGEYLYVVAYDLLDDIHRKGKTPFDLVRGLTGCGRIMQVSLDLAAPGDLDDELTGQLPLRVLYASVLEPSLSADLFEVPEEQITVVTEALLDLEALAEAPVAAPAPVPEPTMPPPAPVAQEPLSALAPEVLPAASAAPAEAAASTAKATPTETSLRVNVEVLEALMNLAGELVLSRNQLVEAIAAGDAQALAQGGQRLNLVTSELQAAIMQTRMQQIGLVLNKFPRVVRDMARQLGKEIRLELDGTEVELDKTLVEGLNDPLTHMVRNAVDHGIEPAAQRRAAGKPGSGLVKLSAWHEAGQVIIEIRDDGKGLDTARIAASAISKGLITEAQVRAMTEQERLHLIFLPGLSTAAAITDVSGRGVGMDVVKTNLDKLGGHVEIESTPGQGARFRIKLPLTLAIIPSLLVAVGGERFAIPQTNVGELIRIPAEAVRERIEPVGDRPVLRLRGELVPLLSLPEVLGLSTGAGEPGPASLSLGAGGAAHDLNIVVVSAGLVSYGLVVESLHDTQEIVVKPLGRHLKGLHEYAGATIMGDGQVALILDVAGMAAKAGLSSATLQQEVAADGVAEAEGETTALLLFRNGPNEPCAVPLGLVSRLERIDSSVIEMVGGQRVMPYRGGSLPLVELSDAAPVAGLGEAGERVVVLFEAGGHEVGLLANAPVDALDIAAVIDSETLRQPGISGSFLYDGQTTMLVDLFDVLGAVYPDWRPAAGSRGSRGRTVLLAEDSDFFRAQVRRYLEADGYTVVEAVDGQEAWEQLAEHATAVEAVVTDIEMPRLDGYGLTRRIRDSQEWRHLPIIALTSLAGDDDIARGKAVGITDYQVKLDRDRLLDGLRVVLDETGAAAAAA